MSGNTAAYGGAVTAAPGARVTMESGTIRSNTASADGGAFYVEGKRTSSTENTEEDDKEVIVTESGSLTVSGGSVTSNTASLGSAIYAADYAAATVTNAGITGNTASGTNGGAINAGGRNARLYFGGTPTVFDNFGALGKNQQMNLVLSEDSNEVINTTEDGLVNGVIGVFVIESDNTVFEKHGLPGKPLGTFGDTTTRFNPQVFRSDHSLSLYGVRNDEDTSDTLIYWVDVICKLTDVNDRILYQDITLTINGKQDTRKAQAVYARITEYTENPDAVTNGFNALRDGFDAAQGELFVRNGDSYTAYPYTTGTAIRLKMLKDVLLDKTIQYSGNRPLTFTTAENATELSTADIQTMRANGDYFLFGTERTDENSNKALITRAFNDNSMLNDAGTGLTVANIQLDGAKNTYTGSTDGGIVNVASGSALTVTDGAYLQNAHTTAAGGAVYVSANGTVTMTGGTISGNTADSSGGAVYVANGATMTMSDGTKSDGTVTAGTINGNRAADGAGIYLAWNNANDHAILNLSGNLSFGGTDRVTQDELNNGTVTGKAVDDLKGTDGNFARKDASFKTEVNKETTNGSKPYPKDGEGYYLVRQDIFIPGTAEPHTAVRVTGNLSSGDGTVWVWAENVNHYEMLKQFAVLYGNGRSLSDAEKENSMRAFRDAQPDSVTNCGGDYLTGQKGEAINNWECIYWTGGFDVVFLKTDGFGQGLPGATFTLYSDPACTTRVEMTFTGSTPATADGKRSTTVSSDGTATYKDKSGKTVTLLKGEVLLPKVPPKTFYLKETAVPTKDPEGRTFGYKNNETVYELRISAAGVLSMWMKDEAGRYTREVYKVQTKAAEGNNPAEYQYRVMNISMAERKVILRKVADKTYTSLQNARFRIFRYDGTPVTSTDINGTRNTVFVSAANGIYFIDRLEYGTYYLYEEKAPTGYTDGKWFTLTVSDDNKSGAIVAEIVDNETIARLNANFVKP